MPRRKKQKPTKPKLLLPLFLVLLSLLITIGLYLTLTRIPSEPEIFLIDESLVFGETTLEGTLVEGLAEDGTHSYLLILDSSQPIRLEIDDFDQYFGERLRLSGTLYPAPDDISPPMMIISSLELVN